MRGRLRSKALLCLVLLFVFLGDLDHKGDIFGLSTSTLEVTFKLLLFRYKCLDVLFINQDFLGERKSKTLTLCLGCTGITILDIVNNQETILSTCEKEIVIIAHAHALDGLAMCLNLIELGKLGHLINVD